MENKVFIQPLENNFDEFLEYAIQHDYNLEIGSFGFANILDTHWKSTLKQYKNKLKNFQGIISVHGAFQDLILSSKDKKIRKVAEDRIYHNLDIAQALNAKYIVFHANFNALISHEHYKKYWIEKNIEFWKSVIKKYKITVVLENLW